jgi:hypothetical protein
MDYPIGSDSVRTGIRGTRTVETTYQIWQDTEETALAVEHMRGRHKPMKLGTGGWIVRNRQALAIGVLFLVIAVTLLLGHWPAVVATGGPGAVPAVAGDEGLARRYLERTEPTPERVEIESVLEGRLLRGSRVPPDGLRAERVLLVTWRVKRPDGNEGRFMRFLIVAEGRVAAEVDRTVDNAAFDTLMDRFHGSN